MRQMKASCPLDAGAVVDLYFMEHRAKVLDLAAFFDRVDRAQASGKRSRTSRGGRNLRAEAREDFRLRALRRALRVALADQPGRAQRVLELLSDPTTQPVAQAPGKGAAGAWAGGGKRVRR